jgi:MATE family multidrug resistance protein
MVEAEVLAFEILTLASSYFGTTALAAQSVLASISSLAWTVPFALSIAGSTRIANLIGATLVDAARTCAKVDGVLAVIVGLTNLILLSALRNYIPWLFTSDEDVARLVSQVLPICASFQLFDSLATNFNGVLRGLGRQSVGGYVQITCYYGIAIPLSMGTAFGLDWSLWGLWTGVAVALFLVTIIEGTFLVRTDWHRSVTDAIKRNETA